MKSINLKRLILPNLPYLLFVFLFDKVGQAARLAPGADLSGKLLSIGDGFAAAFSSFAPSLHPADLLVGVLGAALIRLVVYVKSKNAKKYRRGVEYGSARWGSADDIRPYIDPVFENNVLLTQTERLMMNSRPKQPKYARNKNVLVVGGSGSGKTRFFVKPNLMQMHSSYLVSDPKGTLLLECGKLLERGSPKLGEDGKPVRKNGKLVYEPYRIKVLNTINFKKSMKYNPFAYLRDEKDILKLVNTLIANTKGSGEKSGEDFWVKAERLLYCALIGYIHYEAPDAERNFTTLLEMPFKVPPGTKTITEMAPTKSNDRILPITEEALPYFLRQFDLIARQKALTEAGGGVYYDNKLFIAKPDGSPQRRDRMSANFGQLIRHLEMPHIRFHDLRHTAATNMHQLTGDFYTVGEILGHTLKGIGISLGISTNLEAVTAQYVDVRLERKQSVLQTYHKALQPKTTVTGKEAGQETSKKAKKKSSEMEL